MTLDLSGQEINDKGIESMAKPLADNQVTSSFFYAYSLYSDRH